MPLIPIIMPQLGESIAEATVINLLVKAGDQVRTDQDVMEVETSKATMNVASPCPRHCREAFHQAQRKLSGWGGAWLFASEPGGRCELGLDAPASSEQWARVAARLRSGA